MTVTTSSNKAIGNGNGATTVWPFAFYVLDEDDLDVYYTAVNGDETLLSAASYTVSLNANQASNPGGSVTYSPAIASGTLLTVIRVVDYLQSVDIVNQSGFYPEVVEGALDKLAMGLQQVEEKVSRALTTPVSDAGASIGIPTPEAGKYLRWNVTEDDLENASLVAEGVVSLPLSIANGGTAGTTGATARTNLGSTATGDALFIAANAAAARTTLGLGTAAVLNTGVASGDIPLLTTGGKLPAVDGSLLTNLVSGDPIYRWANFI
jgi:hypothetical protein